MDAALNVVDLCIDDQNSQCLNMIGSFQCVCAPGFVRQNGTCESKINITPNIGLLHDLIDCRTHFMPHLCSTG